MIELSAEQVPILRSGAVALQESVQADAGIVGNALGQLAPWPPSLSALDGAIKALLGALASSEATSSPASVDESLGPICATVVLRSRRLLAERVEVARLAASDPNLIAAVDKQLDVHRVLLASAWFRAQEPMPLFHLAHALTPQTVSQYRPSAGPRNTPFDDKFRILYASSGIVHARMEASKRDVPIGVAFLDIDNFKRYNETYGETEVDTKILPPFFRVVEQAGYGAGQAFRHGGDEVVLLFPHAERDVGLSYLYRVTRFIRTAPYAGITDAPTVSVGLVVVPSDSWLTDREILRRASDAKKAAKRGGKDRITIVEGRSIEDPQVAVISARSTA